MDSLVDTPIPWNEAPASPAADLDVSPTPSATRGSSRVRLAGGTIGALLLVVSAAALIVALAGGGQRQANHFRAAPTVPAATPAAVTTAPMPTATAPPPTPAPSAAPFQPCRTEISWWQDAAGIYHQMVIYHCDPPAN